MPEAPPTTDVAVVERARTIRLLIVVLAATLILGALAYAMRPPEPAPATVTVRPSATIVTAVRELARLETTELHVEKVVDLTDTQSRFFGLVEGTDAILLVASGDVTVGVDLSKLADGDVGFDPATKRATFRLPAPEVFSTRLDEDKTYVYTRTTSLVAKRNEHLEERARKEAVAAMEKAAHEDHVTERAKRQAENELRALATGLGASDVAFTWK